MKTALYLRISLDQTGQALGVTRQEEDCRKLADDLSWDVAEVYIDNDISATSGKARPGYRKMLADIEAGQIEAIIAWAPDRIYRRARDLEELIPILENNSTAVRTVKAGDLDLTSAYGRMIARILGAVATGEGEIKSERWKRSIRQRREAGMAPAWGPRLFGYTRDGKIVDHEAEVIRDIATRILDGHSIIGIARDLNEAGERTTLGNEWKVASVRKLITNPRLAGHSTLSTGYWHDTKKTDDRGQAKQVRRYDTTIIGTGEWPAILAEHVWQEVTAILSARSGTPRRPRVALLPGLVYCGNCGTRLVTGARSRRGDNPSQRIYRCPTVPGGLSGCGKLSIQALEVEQIVEAYARERMDDPRLHARVAELRGGAVEVIPEINALSARISEIDAQLSEPGVPLAALMAARSRAQERLEELSGQLATPTPSTLPTRGAGWPDDLGQRRALVELAVARVTILPATSRTGFDPSRVHIDPR